MRGSGSAYVRPTIYMYTYPTYTHTTDVLRGYIHTIIFLKTEEIGFQGHGSVPIKQTEMQRWRDPSLLSMFQSRYIYLPGYMDDCIEVVLVDTRMICARRYRR